MEAPSLRFVLVLQILWKREVSSPKRLYNPEKVKTDPVQNVSNICWGMSAVLSETFPGKVEQETHSS